MKLKIFYFLSVIIISFTLISCVSVPEKGEKEKPAYNYKTIEVKENLDYLAKKGKKVHPVTLGFMKELEKNRK